MITDPHSPTPGEPTPAGPDRRTVLRRGSLAAAGGMSALVLPAASVAASVGGESETTDPPVTETTVPFFEGETFSAPSPEPQPPVTSARTTLDSVTIGTDSIAGATYEYSLTNTAPWTNMGVGSLSNNFVVSGLTGDSHTVYVRKDVSGVYTTSRIELTRTTQTVTSASGVVMFAVPAGDSGVRQVSLVAVGGRGGRGGNDTYFGSTTSGAAPGHPGRVEATFDVTAGSSFVMRAGSGGTNGQDKTGGTGGTGGGGGVNGLDRAGATGTYEGGKGGNAGTSFYSGGGGGGGAATVVQSTSSSGTPIVVAAGSGGGGGAEWNESPSAPNPPAPGQDYSAEQVIAGSTAGQVPANGANRDCGGHGGGGGGYLGGSSRQTSAAAGFFGSGGYRGQNHVASAVGGVTAVGTPSDGNDTGRSVGAAGFATITYLAPAIFLGV